MFEAMGEEAKIDMALRQGLRELPVPETSPEFDAWVMSAVLRPLPWWRNLIPALRPLVAGAACSTVLTFLLVRWAMQMPDTGRRSAGTTIARTTTRSEMASGSWAFRSGSSARMEDALDRTDLTAFSLARLWMPRNDGRSAGPQSSAPRSPDSEPQTVRPNQSRLLDPVSTPFV